MNSIWGNRKGEGGLHRHISTENPPPFLKKFTSSASFCFAWNLREVSGGFHRQNFQYFCLKYCKFEAMTGGELGQVGRLPTLTPCQSADFPKLKENNIFTPLALYVMRPIGSSCVSGCICATGCGCMLPLVAVSVCYIVDLSQYTPPCRGCGLSHVQSVRG